MNRVFAILTLVGVAYILLQSFTRHGTAPAIAVALGDKSSWETAYVPMVDHYSVNMGNSTLFEQGRKIYTAGIRYQVLSTKPGHFVIQAHYRIERNGVSAEYDRTLPVRDIQPEQSKWVNVDSQVAACASDSPVKFVSF